MRKLPEERFPSARSLRSALGEARSVMAVEPFLETTQPDRPTGGREGSDRALKTAREVLRTPTGLAAVPPARGSAGFKKLDTTERMATRPGGGGAAVPAPIAPLMRTQVSAPHVVASKVAAEAPHPAVPGPKPVAKSRDGLVLVLIVLGVALLVFLGGLFVLFVV
jgi:hypothetical protein